MEEKIKLDGKVEIQKDFSPIEYETWKEKVIKDLKGKPFEKLITKTYEGIDLRPIYIRQDIEHLPQTYSTPGFTNYIRGTKAEGYTNGGWEISQELPYGDAEKFNSALRNDLSRGQTAINLQLDSATLLGIDADYAEIDEVGDCGLSLSGLNSLTRALNGIDLNKFPIYINAGFTSLPMLSMLVAFCKKNDINLQKISGSVEADPFGYLASTGNLPVSEKFAFDKIAATIKWAVKNNVNLRTIGISGLSYNSAGASASEELAYVFSTAISYIDELLERGLTIDEIAPKIRFTFAVGPFYFMEIAKFRAARVIWSNIIDSYNGNEESKKILIHGRTATINQTSFDPYVNMLRTTTEAFSAVIGGVDSLHTNPFDETFRVPNTFSRRIARNTQIILGEESNLNRLIDPAGGSYFVESLTKELAEKAWVEFQSISENGGMLKALINEVPQSKIEETFEARLKDIRKRKSSIVGNNNYSNPKEDKPKFESPDFSSFAKVRADYLQKFRVSGNPEKHKIVLSKLGEIVDSNDTEIIDLSIEAIELGATIGEISKVLRSKNDGTLKVRNLPIRKLSMEFDNLKNLSFEIETKRGKKPTLGLLTMGPTKQFKARADFSRGFFETGGISVIYPNGFNSNDEALQFVKENNPDFVTICSTDENYPEIVPALTKGVKEINAKIKVIVAGYPKDHIESFKNEGVDDFIFMGADAFTIISKLLSEIGD